MRLVTRVGEAFISTAMAFAFLSACSKGGGGGSSTPPADSGSVPAPAIPGGESAAPLTDPAAAPELPPPEPEIPPPPPPTELRIKESQFWIYRTDGDALVFNTPWDEEKGDGIIRNEKDKKIPAYAKRCLKESQEIYQALAESSAFQAKIQPILAQWATPELTFLVVVSDQDNPREALRRLDRDSYFWHWSNPAKKPVLTLNQYEKGTWVWEAIATPKTCRQPVLRELGRYLDFAAQRLKERGAKP